MSDTASASCTCVGCPPKAHRILVHAWQDRLWFERHIYEPCADREGCCGCREPATQEDLLCDGCRDRGGISALDERRILACLAGSTTGAMT